MNPQNVEISQDTDDHAGDVDISEDIDNHSMHELRMNRMLRYQDADDYAGDVKISQDTDDHTKHFSYITPYKQNAEVSLQIRMNTRSTLI